MHVSSAGEQRAANALGGTSETQRKLCGSCLSASTFPCIITSLLCLSLCDPMDCSPPGSSIHGDSSGKNTGVGCRALLQGNLPNPSIKHRSPALQVDSSLSEPPGKPKNTGVGSLSLLQRIFPTQESTRCLLHCRWILYQLSYWGRLFQASGYLKSGSTST